MELSKKKIAFIGAVGIPNVYGGFEIFLETTAPLMAQRCSVVYVTCDSARYADHARLWRGVRRIFIPIPANGLWSVLHDLAAFVAVFWRVNAVVVLGVSGGIFFPLFRTLCAIARVRLIVNVDGLEWRRTKFSAGKRAFLYFSDRLAQLFSHCVIFDNEALRPYLSRFIRNRAVYIPYPGDHARPAFASCAEYAEPPYCLTICRIEPENNCHMLLEAFANVGGGRYTFVGNWHDSEYGRKLKAQFGAIPHFDLRDPVYDSEVLVRLRQGCALYLHGHSVGGTNPSLVEMLFYDCPILAFDCAFNRATAEDGAEYFSSQAGLVAAISKLTISVQRDIQWANKRARRSRAKYLGSKICMDYWSVICRPV